MNKLQYIINALGGLIAIAIILYFIDVGRIWEIISGSHLELILLAAIVYLSLNAVMAMRIKLLLAAAGKQLPLRSALEADLGGMLASDFTPARSGYFLTAFLLSSKHGIKLEKTMLSIFGPQLLEFLLKAVCCSLLFVFLLNHFEIFKGQELLVFAAIGAIISGIVFFLFLLFHPTLLERFSFMKIGPGKKIFYLFHLMRENSDVMRSRWVPVLCLTIIGWLLKGVEWLLLSRALGFSISDPLYDYVFFLFFQPFVTIIHFLPLPTLAGAGTGEAAGSAILALFGVPLDVGLSFGFLTRGLMLIVDLLGLPAVLAFLRKESFDGILKDIDTMEERLKGG